jgi:hypothetical protein
LLVAVTVYAPTPAFTVSTAEVAVCVPSDPRLVPHVTPTPPTSFFTVAVKVTVCETAAAPRSGEIDTLIAGGGGGGEEADPQPLRVRTINKAKKFHSLDRTLWRLNVVDFIESFRALCAPRQSESQ